MLELIKLEKNVIIRSDYSEKIDSDKLTKFHWLRAISPSTEEVRELSNILDFDKEDEEELLDFLKEGSRPRLIKEKYVQVVYSVPFKDNGDVITEPIIIFSLNNLIITVEREKFTVCEDILKVRKRNKKTYMFKGNSVFFMSELIDQINDEFLYYVNNIDNKTDIITSKQMDLTRKHIDIIFSASTTLAFFNNALMANIEVLSGLKKLHHKLFKTADREIFNEIYFDALQIRDNGKIQSEVVMNIFNMQSIVNAQQMNVFMKKLTSLALLIMIPTLVSGLYGMNVVLPFADVKNSFFLIIGITAVITFIIYFIFKKVDWV